MTHSSGTRLVLHIFSLVWSAKFYNMPNIPNSDPGLAAASVLNWFSLLWFWLRHLPPRLPTPTIHSDPVYTHFYRVLDQVRILRQSFPATVPDSEGVITIRVHEASPSSTRRSSAPEAQDLAASPAPQPNHRPPRDVDRYNQPPEAQQPQPPTPPPTPFNRRKSLFPRKRD